MLYAFYAYGGIETIGLMSMQLKKKEDAPKAGKVMLIVLTIIDVISIGLVITMISFESICEKESPFVTALSSYRLSFFPHVFNATIITAGFYTMTASLFAVTNLLVMLAKDGDAPRLFEKKLKFRSLPLPSLGLAAIGLSASVITALLLPGKSIPTSLPQRGFCRCTTGESSFCQPYKILTMKLFKDKFFAIAGIVLLAIAVTGTIMEKSIRLGFFISLVLSGIVAAVTWIMTRVWIKSKAAN